MKKTGRRMIAAAISLSVVAATLAVVLACAGTATASPAGDSYHYDPELRWWVHQTLEVASWSGTYDETKTIPKPVEVRCYTDGRAFEASRAARGYRSEDGVYRVEAYYDGGNTIHMRTLDCSQALRFTQGIITPTTSLAFVTLLHEALHRQGFKDEWSTEEHAIAVMFTAGRLIRWTKAVAQNGADEDAYWDSREALTAGYLARDYALAVNKLRPAAYRVTKSDVERAQRLGWADWAH